MNKVPRYVAVKCKNGNVYENKPLTENPFAISGAIAFWNTENTVMVIPLGEIEFMELEFVPANE